VAAPAASLSSIRKGVIAGRRERTPGPPERERMSCPFAQPPVAGHPADHRWPAMIGGVRSVAVLDGLVGLAGAFTTKDPKWLHNDIYFPGRRSINRGPRDQLALGVPHERTPADRGRHSIRGRTASAITIAEPPPTSDDDHTGYPEPVQARACVRVPVPRFGDDAGHRNSAWGVALGTVRRDRTGPPRRPPRRWRPAAREGPATRVRSGRSDADGRFG
jgi:hypothetical protein